MTHEIRLAEDSTLEERANRLIVDLGGSAPGPLSLGISLLNESLVDDLSLRPPQGPWAVRLRKSTEPRDIRFRRYGNQRLELTLGQIELERWLIFFLKYYRDGSAEVDHMDVEGEWDNSSPCDLTIKVSEFVPPMSEDETRQRLGLKSRR